MDRARLAASTRDRVCRDLGIPAVVERAPDPSYRESAGSGIDGDWVGGFSQPGVVLSPATAMRASISGGDGSTVERSGSAGPRSAAEGRRGVSIDEYGRATLQVITHPDRFEIIKRYDGQGTSGVFRYVGAMSDGMLTGFWHLLPRPSFCGVFWLARVDRTEPAAIARIERRVRVRSPRKWIAQVAIAAVCGTFVLGAMTSVWLMLGAMGVTVGSLALYQHRRYRLLGDVARWRRLLA